MDLINELAFIISKNKPGVMNQLVPEGSKVKLLYDLIVKKKVETDSQAAKIIYNTDRSDKKYLMLKRNLVVRLSELVFLQDNYESYKENYSNLLFTIRKELNIAEKLILENVYHNPTKIIAKVEQQAEKYFLIDLQLEAARKFRSVYSLKGFPTETEIYDDKIKLLSKYQRYYSESQGMWEILYSKLKYTIAKTPETAFQAYYFSETIRKWLNEYNSPFLKLYYYKINIVKNNLQNKYNKVFENIQKLDKLTIEFDFIKTSNLTLEIYQSFAWYYRNIKDLNQALPYILKCLSMSDYRAFNKFDIQQIYFDVLIKLEKYADAAMLLQELYDIPQFEYLDKNDKSAWLIREAYLYFIIDVKKLSDCNEYLPNFNENFDLELFLEKTKKSSKDKYGYNILLLIIRLIFLARLKPRYIDNEGNNLLIYHHRYLKDINSPRTSAFFYALGKLAAKGMEKDYANYRYEKLLSTFKQIKPSAYDTYELVPYESLWNLIVESIS